MPTKVLPSDCDGAVVSGKNYCVKASIYIKTEGGGSNLKQCEGNCAKDTDCKCTATFSTSLLFINFSFLFDLGGPGLSCYYRNAYTVSR